MQSEHKLSYDVLKKVVFLVFVFDNGATNRIKQHQIAERAGMSQQSVSRLLNELEREGLVQRRVAGRGEYVALTERGLEYLKALQVKIRGILLGPQKISLRGRVISGLGEGRYYLSIPYYAAKLREYFGKEVYPGTLNIEIEPTTLYNRTYFESVAEVIIPGFSNGKRTYGSAKLVRCSLNGYGPCAIIIPSRTHHPFNVIEIVSPAYLRGELGLKDGDEVIIEVAREGEA